MKPTVVFEGRVEPAEDYFRRYLRSAAALAALGVGPGDVVALMLRNGPAALELTLATRWIGAQWCPVNWHYRSAEVAQILQDSGARVFIAHADLLAGLDGLDLQNVATFAVAPEGAADPAHAAATPFPPWDALRDATSGPDPEPRPPRGAMFFTSGTTGRPKGIRRDPATPEQVQRGREVLRHVSGFEPGMRALVSAPLYHSAPNSYSIGAALEDATLFIERRFDAEETLRLIERHRITHAYLVPTMYVRMLRLPAAVRARHDLSSIRFVASTGSPCPPQVKLAMIEWWGPVIHEAYGASELGYMTRLDSDEALRKPGSAGKPLPGVTVRILDEHGREQPRGSAGLIYVRQPAYSDFTYAGNAEARSRMERDGLLTMGDVGYLDDDGFLFIVDRSADLVISGGVNIYPAEIEAVMQLMPGVVDCAVFGVPDAEFGEALLAVVQPAAGAALDADAVRAFVGARLAGFKVPRHVVFRDDMPREDTGKIFKRKLREPYWQGADRRI
jgi:long-chain acyl-CoA synthetase